MLSVFFPVLVQVLLISSISVSGGHDKDELALLSFKEGIMEDPLNILTSWNTSQHFCSWQGVTCGRRHKRITSLDLQSCQLKGQLSSHIGNLSFLRSLILANNSFIHDIPPQISNLFRIKFLALGNNSFSGKIPTNLSRCSDLQYLDLSFNKLSGKVPGQDISLLSKLQVLLLNNNNLFGEIPASLGNLSSLLRLHLGDNKFHGVIPQSFGQLKSLVGLAIYNNKLKGIIPPSIYNISSLEVLMLQTNQLEGTLPPPDLGKSLPSLAILMLHTNRLHGTLPLDFGNYFPNLKILTLHKNDFSGPIPATILNMSKATVIEMSSNYFTEEVPCLGSLSKLRIIGISGNNLGHCKNDDLKFLSSLVNCTNLEVLGIEDNNFGGVMPESISNFSRKLRDMIVGRNQISGSIPTRIGNLVNLLRLGMDNNQLSGVVPSSVGELKNLYVLGLGRNKLSGHIPSSLGNLTSLSTLDLSENNIGGIIPSGLGQCRELLFLRLSKNNLSGLIPKDLINISSLVFLDLDKNHFTGSIPMEAGKLEHVFFLDISENMLDGEIPESLGGCIVLQYLYLQGNSLQGPIPHSLTSLRGLDEIDLSHNNLSGRIPTYFGGFQFLKKLNLSFNNLEGEVPVEGVFKNLSGISVTGNARLCGGVVQLHLPRCPSERHKKRIRSPPRKLVILGIACGLGLILIVLLILIYFSLKQRTLPSSGSSDDTKSFVQLSYGDLAKATDDFSSANLIGAGSFGSVYKGILNADGTVVAVKVLNLQTSRASKSFVAECRALRNIRHRNIVKVLTACSSTDYQGNDFKALVYEFMANGSLEEWLHGERHLGLVQRMNIAIDVASALDYLHNRCGHIPIVHCDLKPSNILLDKDITAHVGDFGLVRFLSDPSHPFSSNHTSSVGLRGSVGYAAPEYGMGSEVSTSGDVYSYGILLLEMFSGKRPTDGMFRDDSNLHNFALMALPEHVEEILDPRLLETEDGRGENSALYANEIQNQMVRKCLISVVEIGVACSAELPGERMSICDVVSELSRIKDMLSKTGITII